jgi:hypothetical protein
LVPRSRRTRGPQLSKRELGAKITAGNSFLRYRLNDRVRVSGFLGKTPCLEFLGRLGGTDLVGEKISFQKADKVLAKLRNQFSNAHLFFLGAKSEQSQAQYHAIGVGLESDEAAVAAALEKEMLAVHHYACARELGQLKPAGAKLFSIRAEIAALLKENEIKGQSKPESIVSIS